MEVKKFIKGLYNLMLEGVFQNCHVRIHFFCPHLTFITCHFVSFSWNFSRDQFFVGGIVRSNLSENLIGVTVYEKAERVPGWINYPKNLTIKSEFTNTITHFERCMVIMLSENPWKSVLITLDGKLLGPKKIDSNINCYLYWPYIMEGLK
jgi:hypothetical protein